ncbi:transcription termination/antitermination NusG family protein [Roseburia hominis]
MTAKWYVMRTIPGREEEAVSLLNRKIDHHFWAKCRILRKQQLFRVKGEYLVSRKEMFPGYVFIKTECSKELREMLQRSREFPQLVESGKAEIAAVEPEDLRFLQSICGRELERDMGLSTVEVDADGQVRNAEGVLKEYVGQIRRQRLRHRYVTAEVELFNRREDVLFGIRVEGDPE